MTTKRETVLNALRDARRDLIAAMQGVDMQAVLDENGGRLHDWLAYIAAWDREVLAAVQALIENDQGYRTADFDTWETWSSREVARRATWPEEQVRMDFGMVRLELISLLSQMEPNFFEQELETPWDRTRTTIAHLLEAVSIAHDRELTALLHEYKRTTNNEA
ncbi:hypothetical protein ARMA_1975 [Ardenticatena maritima]|uniref:DinB-like domain-containing protein n=1 Tax=Ardenticatena maritima TaxID=872965 RepID=A0A0M8K9L8_9CHLR|nr:hypothetical protein [Ardenticatena maritima]KPL86558.1 hypothetical protein SE16_14945 [Ardenticatena maritima]GAP63552.1 hypothetical protein ARMA_1975 [Ardenticatena maritima]